MRPYHAPTGTVWSFKDHFNDDLYVVLDRYTSNAPEQHPGKEFRMCFDLLKGEVVWMSERSHYNNDSERVF